MRVLQVTRQFHSHGGISRVAYELHENLKGVHDMRVLTSKSEVDSPAITVLDTPQTPLWYCVTRFGHKANEYIREHKSEYDVIHGHDNDCGICTVNTKHSCYARALRTTIESRGPTYKVLKAFDPRADYLLKNEEHLMKNTKNIISVSAAVKREVMEEYGTDGNRITVVHNGVNTSEFTPQKRETAFPQIRNMFGIKPKTILLLFVGNEWKRKGLETAILSLKNLDHIKLKLMIVGKGDRDEYLEVAEKIGVNKRLLFAGEVNNIADYYAAADILVFPTIYEPFGLCTIEALASGTPPIVSKLAGSSEILTDKKDSLLLDDPKNPQELSEKIEYAIDHRQELSKNARETALQHTWAKVAEKTSDVYQKND